MAFKDIIDKASGLFFEDNSKNPDSLNDIPQDLIPKDILKQMSLGLKSLTAEEMTEQMSKLTNTGANIGVTTPESAPLPAEPKSPAAPIINGDIVDFTPIYIESNIPPVPLTAEGFLKMLKELGDIPLPAKRAMVGTMLSTMAKSTPGTDSATITNDALLKIKSLSAYNSGVKVQLDNFVSAREKSIADAEAKIAREKEAITKSKSQVEKLTKWCEREGNTLDDVLEFFKGGDAKPVDEIQDIAIPEGLR